MDTLSSAATVAQQLAPKIDFYDINEDLVKTLVSLNKIQASSIAFIGLNANYQKVNFAEDLLLQFEQLQRFKFKVTLQNSKSNEKSIAFRKEGNEHFSLKSRNYFRALQLYNKSICYSKADSENIAIGYANRSAVLFELKKYPQCLENIQMARNANFPQRLMHKLDKRENDCKKLLCAGKSVENNGLQHNFTLSFNPHPVVPFIADCLAFDSTKDEGRFIYTKTALKPGDVIAIEDPYCSALLPAMCYIRCANCTKEQYFTLIPCPNCTSAMFCSEQCQEEAWNMFHKYECPIIDFLFTAGNKIQLTALRVCLTTLSNFPNADECRQFCQNSENEYKSVFDLDYNNLTKQEEYKAIHGLVTNQEKRTISDLFQRAVICATMKHILLESTPLKEYLGIGNTENQNFFVELLYRHLQTSPSNMHSIDLIEQRNETKDDECFATAAYPFLSLINHSCAPNTVRIYSGTRSILFVLRSIPANGKLFDNYGYHYASQTKKYRQKYLLTQYRFQCNCEACEKDYPEYRDPNKVLAKMHVPDIITEADIRALREYDSEYAFKHYKLYCEFLEKYAHEFPCDQISCAEESLKMALNILVDAVPLKAKV